MTPKAFGAQKPVSTHHKQFIAVLVALNCIVSRWEEGARCLARFIPKPHVSVRVLTRGVAQAMREIIHIQVGQCGNQIGAKVRFRGRDVL